MLLWPLRLAFKLVYFVVLAAVVYLVVSAVQVVSASHLPTAAASAPSARAIVVLGSGGSGSSPNADLAARLEQGVALFRAKRAPTIVVTGPGPSGRSVATPTLEQRWLTSNGVPAASILEVTAGDVGSALTDVSALLGRGTKVVVVTNALAALWTKGAAAQAGLTASISPAVGSERSFYRELGPLWTQSTGVAAGRIIGYRRATWAAH